MFDAWGSQAANDSLSPIVPPSPSPSSSWMPAIGPSSKTPAAALGSQVECIGEKSAADLRESSKSEEPCNSNSGDARGVDQMSEDDDDCRFSDDEDDYSNPQSHNGDDGDDDDDDDDEDALDLYDMDGGDGDGDGDDDDEFEDQHFQQDDWIEDTLEGENLSFFEQQVAAGFMNDNPGLVDGELPADMGGMMADVMEQLGMQPDEALPPGLAAIFETLQVQQMLLLQIDIIYR